jgi:hypothetical protein
MGRDAKPVAQRRVWTRWEPGPAAHVDGPVVVSVTDLTLHRTLDMPDAYRAGLRLRRGWFAMEGAVGLWLWAQPLKRRSGSVSVWRSEDDLRRFVRLPAHVAIMRRYRPRSRLQSRTWHADGFVPADVLAQARQVLGQ